MMFTKQARGFSLVELLVVIAIIGLLTSIVTVSLVGAKQKSRDSKRIADLSSIRLALSLYYNDNLMYPTNIYGSGAAAPAMGLAPAYLSTVPRDPNATASDNCNAANANTLASCYHYSAYQGAGGNGICISSNPPLVYHLGAGLEDTGNQVLIQDTDANDDLEPAPYSVAYVPCTTAPGGNAPSKFHGNATSGSIKCSGNDAQAATPDTCYDVTP